jgi:thiaminase/transcriptional activator TenA
VSVLARLKRTCAIDWTAYIHHPFVRQLGAGTLAEASFKHYLKQDYLFLIHFARAYGLAAFKSETLSDMRHARDALSAVLDTEIGLHVAYCRDWGIGEAELAQLPEAAATAAYTRYVHERGMQGSLLDLHVALSPCTVGYAEVAMWLAGQPFTVREHNPYGAWIDMYASGDYQTAAGAEVAQIDRLYSAEGAGEARFTELATTFSDATRLEIAFWDMGLNRLP